MKISHFSLIVHSAIIAILIFFITGTNSAIGQVTLWLSPNTSSYRIGDNFNLDIFVNTGQQNVVAVAAYIEYDPNHFQVNNIDTTNSVFTVGFESDIDPIRGLIRIGSGRQTPGVNTANGMYAQPIYELKKR